jgi:hypothetical protein
LKEKLRGDGSSKLSPQWVQERCWLKVIASSEGLPSLPAPPAPAEPSPFITTTSAVPPVSPSAVSMDSVSRWRTPSRRTRRSTTTSMVCCS